jgi:hypothetical protein
MGRKVTLAAAMLGTLLGAVRCGGPAKEGGQGAECFRADECAPGLVCIDQACTGDLTSVNFRSEAGVVVDAGTPPPD